MEILVFELLKNPYKCWLQASITSSTFVIYFFHKPGPALLPLMRLNKYDKETLTLIHNKVIYDCSRHYHIDELATMAGMSATRLKAAFKKQFQTTIYQLLLLHRMQLAKTLIEEDEKTLDQVAKLTGYKYTNNFTVAFKKFHGQSPGKLKPR